MAPLLLLLVLLMSAAAADARATALIVFGDSTVDDGATNNAVATLARSNFPPYGRDFPGGRATGRFCNGRLATDFYSEGARARPRVRAGIPRPGIRHPGLHHRGLLRVRRLGTRRRHLRRIPCDPDVEADGHVPRVQDPSGGAPGRGRGGGGGVRRRVRHQHRHQRLPGELLRAGVARPLQFTVPQYTAYLVGLARGFLSELHALGARKIGFAGIGPMGCLPIERARLLGLGCDETHNAAARAFNAALKDMVAQLNRELPGADVRVAEVYDLFGDVVREPARYGFARADVGCCGTGTYEMGYACSPWDPRTCTDASKYVFWDAVHTTEHANRIVAEYLMNTTFGAFS
ncbi:hypothetical protein PR202_ga00661 [Eleusine coracana subsp. coracana]|uniref:GDSL esterase/lipase n=1 Tax=Eleusine coracana subsp. coracana TaxID=191504 RepID=A0AAV5BEM4_ELECO|nr:hypothetical protein PR202_ga00661 [Eleusine coracana subsp. coracana]